MTTIKQAIRNARATGLPKPFGGVQGHPDYSKNLAKAGTRLHGAGETECCAFCGRLVRGDLFRAWTETGSSFDTRSDNENAVGFYPLGSDCAFALADLVPVYTSAGIQP